MKPLYAENSSCVTIADVESPTFRPSSYRYPSSGILVDNLSDNTLSEQSPFTGGLFIPRLNLYCSRGTTYVHALCGEVELPGPQHRGVNAHVL